MKATLTIEVILSSEGFPNDHVKVSHNLPAPTFRRLCRILNEAKNQLREQAIAELKQDFQDILTSLEDGHNDNE